MKVLIFVEAAGGGVLEVVKDQVKILIQSHYEVDILLCRRAESPVNLEFLFEGCSVSVFPQVREDSGFLINLARWYLRETKNKQYDIIHLHSSLAGGVGRAFSIFLKSRIYYTPHCYSFLDSSKNILSRLAYLFIEASLSIIGSVVACGPSEAAIARRLTFRHVYCVPNGVNSQAFDFIDESIELKSRDFDVVSVGRLSPQKGPELYAKLVSKLESNGRQCIWVGGGKEDFLTFTCTGWVDRFTVAQILSKSKIYVSTAKWEGLPLSLVEAQIQGLPVVALKAPGVRDVVTDGVNGFVCSDIEEMEEKIKILLDDEIIYRNFSKESKKSAIEKFSLENYKKLIEVYSENS